MSIEGMTFVITGGARGIGAETARLAASEGAKVVVSDVLEEEGEATVADIVSAGGNAAFVAADVTDPGQVEGLMRDAADTFGGIDVLHNNAGIHELMLTTDALFDDLPLEVFDQVVAVNLRGPFICSKMALPYLSASDRGPSIINAGSTASFSGYPMGLAYGTSKGGIAQMTKNLAVALAPRGIRANCYCPAAVDTPMVEEVGRSAAVADTSTPDRSETTVSGHLVGRIGAPRDIAELVCFLASDKASFVNGVTWLIDGGSLAWRG
ncbi:MAG: SDR family NAD(P)-dependent oxidoreductase [Acidimicrobiales bacterium]